MTVHRERLPRSRTIALLWALGLGVAGCGGDQGGAPTTSAPPAAPAPPAASGLTVAFVQATARVAEGETAEVPLRWSGASPGSALQIGVAVQNDTAADEDYELLTATVEIPPSAAGGTATVSLRALEDELFAEGDETLSVQLVAPSGATVQVGGSLEVVIEEAGVSPCTGIRVAAAPPSLENHWGEGETEQPSETAMTRFILVSGAGSDSVAVDWIGPYRDYDLYAANFSFYRQRVSYSNLFDLILEDWSFHPEESGLRHEFRLEWLSNLEVGLRFRSADGACTGEPVAACTGAGCELRP